MALARQHPHLELDHVFVCTEDRARAREALIAAGLHPGPGRVHSGQGTANDCFYFENAYLELLWLNDETEIRSPLAQPLGLWDRIHWKQTGACPFGLAVRPLHGLNLDGIGTWPYRPPYLPAGASISILTPQHATREPLVFAPPYSMPPANYPPARRAPLIHRGRLRRITAITIEVPQDLAWLNEAAHDVLLDVAQVGAALAQLPHFLGPDPVFSIT